MQCNLKIATGNYVWTEHASSFLSKPVENVVQHFFHTKLNLDLI